jgi:hypothetical protein
MTIVQIDLPDTLAQQARQAGLFAAPKMESILRAQLRREAVQRLRAAQTNAAEELTGQIEQEIVEIVRDVRRQRRTN